MLHLVGRPWPQVQCLTWVHLGQVLALGQPGLYLVPALQGLQQVPPLQPNQGHVEQQPRLVADPYCMEAPNYMARPHLCSQVRHEVGRWQWPGQEGAREQVPVAALVPLIVQVMLSGQGLAPVLVLGLVLAVRAAPAQQKVPATAMMLWLPSASLLPGALFLLLLLLLLPFASLLTGALPPSQLPVRPVAP